VLVDTDVDEEKNKRIQHLVLFWDGAVDQAPVYRTKDRNQVAATEYNPSQTPYCLYQHPHHGIHQFLLRNLDKGAFNATAQKLNDPKALQHAFDRIWLLHHYGNNYRHSFTYAFVDLQARLILQQDPVDPSVMFPLRFFFPHGVLKDNTGRVQQPCAYFIYLAFILGRWKASNLSARRWNALPIQEDHAQNPQLLQFQ